MDQSEAMEKPAIDCIVFDLGGVLIDWNPRYLYRKLFKNETEMEYFLTHICHGQWNEMQDAGRTFDEAVNERVSRFPEHSEFIRAYRDRWPEMIAGAIDGTVEILKALSTQGAYRLYALTNWSAETFPYARRTFPFLNLFEGIVVSGEEKMIKPDHRFFNVLIERHDIRPQRSVFIDDSAKNIAAARELGFQTVQFTTSNALLETLRTFGIQI